MAGTFEIEELLAEAGWLRGLAASLIRDATQADDLVQDTWLAALRRPPHSDAEPRPWLARVARNLARNARRQRVRLRAREGFAHEERAQPSPAALAQEAEGQRLLAEAVTRLAEPQRAVIVLRYFQGLDSSAAAARLGLSASAVRTRLQRALEELRADLDRHFEGGRKGWGLLLAPLVRGAAATGDAGAPVMAGTAPLGSWSLALVACAGGACVLAAAGSIYWSFARGAGGIESASAAAPSAVIEEAGSQEAAPPPAGERKPLDPPVASVPVSGSVGTPAASVERNGTELSGTIFVDGRAPQWPIGLALEPTILPVSPGDKLPRLRVRRDELTLAPEQQGRFTFGPLSPSWSGRLVVSGYTLANGESSFAIDAPRSGLVLQLRSGPAVFGRILDPFGHPVPGLEGRCQLRVGRAESLVHEETLRFACRADGRFRIPCHGVEESPGGEDWGSFTLRVEAEGHGYLDHETPAFAPADGLDLGELELEPLRALAFTVRDPQGTPIEGVFARVEGPFRGKRVPLTGADGSGVLELVPDRAVDVRFSAFDHADRVVRADPREALEVVLEPLSVLDLRLVGSLVGQANRVRLSSERAAFVWDESDWDERALLQVELGSIHPVARRAGAIGKRWEYEFQHQYDGRFHLVGLVPYVPITVEVLDPDGRVLAVGTVSAGAALRTELELGDPSSAGVEPVRDGLPKRRSPASPR